MSSLKPPQPSRDVRTALMYAGEIPGRARFDIVNPKRTNLAFEPFEVTVNDARDPYDSLGLDSSGFDFVRHASEVAQEPQLFDGNLGPENLARELSAKYHRELCEFLQRRTGAILVFPQIGALVMRTSQKATRKSWAGPANFVHLDYTAQTAHQFLAWSAAAHQLELPPFKRLVVYQTWRAVSRGPQDNTLCICDGRTAAHSESIVFDSVLGPEQIPGKFFESRLCRRSEAHRWYYLSNMEPEDLLIFKGFDSDDPESMNAMHTAFDNPLAGNDAVPRRSIEARFLALFA